MFKATSKAYFTSNTFIFINNIVLEHVTLNMNLRICPTFNFTVHRNIFKRAVRNILSIYASLITHKLVTMCF